MSVRNILKNVPRIFLTLSNKQKKQNKLHPCIKGFWEIEVKHAMVNVGLGLNLNVWNNPNFGKGDYTALLHWGVVEIVTWWN